MDKYSTTKYIAYGSVLLIASHLVPIHLLHRQDPYFPGQTCVQEYRFVLPEQKHVHWDMEFVPIEQVVSGVSTGVSIGASSSQV